MVPSKTFQEPQSVSMLVDGRVPVQLDRGTPGFKPFSSEVTLVGGLSNTISLAKVPLFRRVRSSRTSSQ